MRIRTLVTTAAVSLALVAGGVAAPVAAVAPPVALDVSQVPANVSYGASCTTVVFPVTIYGGAPDGDYSITGSLTNGSATPTSVSTYGMDPAARDVAGVPQQAGAFICSSSFTPGAQTLTLVLKDYENVDAAYNPTTTQYVVPVFFKSTDTQIDLNTYKVKGKKATLKGSISKWAKGKKVYLYTAKKGSSKYKKLASATVKIDKYGYGTYTFKLKKKLAVGTKAYAKFKGSTILSAKNSVKGKIVRR